MIRQDGDPVGESLEIRPLGPGVLRDFLTFFDRDAFADNPHWAGCYCYYNLADHDERPWEGRSGSDNRQAVQDLIRSGRMRGYLAYSGGVPVGWCHAAPRRMIRNVDQNADLATGDSHGVGSIVCFVVARPQRGQGVAKRLLDAACDGFHKEGLQVVEAYPRKEAETDAGNYHGPLSMYVETGFEKYRETDEVVVVRKSLG